MTGKTAGAYITGLFKNGAYTGAPAEAAMISSAMTDYIFWSIHVHDNGDLYYNNDAICAGGSAVAAIAGPIGDFIAKAKANHAASSVWFSIGAGGVHDFQAIETILNNPSGPAYKNLFANFAALYALGGDGFDFDYEESIADPVSTISTLGADLYKQLGARITYCPYYGESVWIQCLQQTLIKAGVQPVEAFRLQCYSGGYSNDPRDWVTALEQAGAAKTGVSDPAAFVRPGMAIAGGSSTPQLSPSQMAARIKSWGSPGGWIWNTEEVLKVQPSTGHSIADYAIAILGAAKD
ncbi:hypothetical protein F1654_04350 [Alkalicaulis satelles]|uniref:GH18 domain-containing protein n=1 Tax=Alkalicaulis satelles TaxID=2609175 RepID=A0A5M6ZSD4_9PROT|nr:hypothetical protein [Alkalicaulis satelles]KAA5805221.1 hypothetical protein F1654_04350 [Alkalicaulis satelles]